MQTQDITHETTTGCIIDHGAHVMGWEPRGRYPVLFTSAAAVYAKDTAIRGGVPICFPWFGPGRAPDAPYGHGFARTATWRHLRDEEDSEAFTTVYALTNEEATDEYWPHAFEAVLTARFGSELTISLAVTNHDSQAFSYEAALHTYLAVDSIHDVRIEGLDGARYVDKTDEGAVKEQAGPLTFDGEVDNVYETARPVEVIDVAAGRSTHVNTSGATHIIVWNPGRELAATIGDLGPGDWERFVCVEAGRVFDGAVSLEPGQSHTLSTTISI
ncbi:MAG: D-hexose-6-phosphate mutarotase [Actinomycetia bacterium]|nr:D-hexose-6-phosphate mutarotase [Actinomycetes bacterium]